MRKKVKSLLILLTLVLLTTVPVSASEQGIEGKVVLTTEKEGGVLVGEKVIYTAQASSEGEIEYGFSESYEGIAATDDIIYSSENTYTFQPEKAGSYVIEVEIRAKEAKTVKGRQSITIEVKAPENAELTGNLTSSRGNAAVYINRTVTLTGSHTGGAGTCKYQYTEEYNGQTKVVRAYDENPKYTFNTNGKGKHTYHLDIQDESGQTVRVSHSIQVNPEKSRVLSGTLKSSRGNAAVYVNRTVMLTGNHSGGYGECEYKYSEVYNGKTTIVQAYSSNRNYTFKTKGVGKHTYYLDIRDKEGQIVRKSYTVQINSETSKKLKSTLKSSRGNAAVYINRTITLTGNHSGGYGKCEYRYTESYKGTSKVLQDYSEKSTYVIRTQGVGKHIYYLDIRDEQGQTLRKTYTVQVNPEPDKELNGTLKSSRGSASVYINRSITLTGIAAGGYGRCEYRYSEYYNGNKKVLRDYGEDAIYTFRTQGVGRHTYYLDIRDEAGQTVQKIYTVQINAEPANVIKAALTSNRQGVSVYENRTVVLKGSHTGGYGKCEYRYTEVYKGKTKTVKSYGSAGSEYRFTTSGIGKHIFYLDIKDEQNQVVRKSYTLWVVLKQPYGDMLNVASGSKSVTVFNSPQGLSNSVKSRVNNATKALTAQGYNVGYIMMDLKTGAGIAYNPDGTFYSASSIKGPYVACLNEKIPSSTSKWKSTMYETITVSSNSGYMALRNAYGSSAFKTWLKEAGCSNINAARNYPSLTARSLGKMWIKNYNYFTSGKQNAVWCASIYTHSLNSVIYNSLKSKYTVYSKPGWIGEGGYYNVQNDGGIVLKKGNPYVIVILSSAYGRQNLLNNLVYAIDAAHSELIKE